MKELLRSLTSEQDNRQETFWKIVDQHVRQLAADLAEKILELQLQAQLQAG